MSKLIRICDTPQINCMTSAAREKPRREGYLMPDKLDLHSFINLFFVCVCY